MRDVSAHLRSGDGRRPSANEVNEMSTEGKRTRKVKIEETVGGVDRLVEKEIDEALTIRWQPREQMRLLGTAMARVDGPVKVSGAALYTQDIKLPGMLYGSILLAPYAHARIRSLDLTPALKRPGVRAAMTAAEVYRALMTTAKELRIEDVSEIRYEGQPVAVLAAETPEEAKEALPFIEVDYEILPHCVCGEDALAHDAPLVFKDGNFSEQSKAGDPGEVEAALRSAALVVEAEYRTPVIHHVALEPHAVIVDYRGASATVYMSTQGTHYALSDFARELGLPESEVTIEVQHVGGGFGSKFTIGMEGRFACQLSMRTKRPVKVALDRRTEFLMSGNREGSRQKMKAGIDRDGRIVALLAEQHAFGGIGVGRHALQPLHYRADKHAARLTTIHTHTNSRRAMRAPGRPEASFAIESLVDELAYALKMDPIELRKRNLEDVVYHRQLDRGALEIGWHKRNPSPGRLEARMRGIGCGVSQWGGWGGPGCQTTVTIMRDGSVESKIGTQDIGTGTRTLVRAVVAEELGLGLADVRERIGSTRYGHAIASGGSGCTASTAPALKDAALKARLAFASSIAPHLGVDPSEIALADGRVRAGTRTLKWKQACALLPRSGIVATGEWKPGCNDGGSHGACFAEVEVDRDTGAIRPIKIVHIQDVGFPLNRLAVESQIIGGVIQGMGMALHEERVIDRRLGKMLTASLVDYKVPGAMEVPEIVPIIDDEDTREGVVGVGEPPAIAAVGAIANAVFNATGVRVRELPITPDKVLMALVAKETS
jgi:xanthine dehydrogenase YagR molybdenum-binding subunit